MVTPGPEAPELEALRRRVAELESALRMRSLQLVRLLDRLPPSFYPIAACILAGRPLAPRLALQPGEWEESVDLVRSDVEEVLVDLWSAAGPPGAARTP